MERPLIEAALLGMLHGITEILPVSSTGHLALSEILFGLRASTRTLALIELGVLLATVVVLRQRIRAALLEVILAASQPSRLARTPGGREALTVLLATPPTLAISFALRGFVGVWASSPLVVGLGFLVTAVVLLSARWVRGGKDDAPTPLGAVLIGAVQGLALLPGISRSGAVIVLALWLGIRPVRAFEVAMLTALPAMLGAAVFRAPELGVGTGALVPALVASALAFGFALGALLLLRQSVLRGYFSMFVLWVIPLSVATLALARAWPGG
ncbi:MAG TPA: undecaprenyl-diphosphate phosphatase [Polyangiaceae bacterium]|nr:undecaprenyl-diphosphate phosphatase [Polyangiaceae bacterium]